MKRLVRDEEEDPVWQTHPVWLNALLLRAFDFVFARIAFKYWRFSYSICIGNEPPQRPQCHDFTRDFTKPKLFGKVWRPNIFNSASLLQLRLVCTSWERAFFAWQMSRMQNYQVCRAVFHGIAVEGTWIGHRELQQRRASQRQAGTKRRKWVR